MSATPIAVQIGERPDVLSVEPGAGRPRIERVLQAVRERPDREQLGDVLNQDLGIPSVGNQIPEMNVSGRIARLTNTGAASAFGHEARRSPIPSVVNAAVPSTRTTISAGSVDTRIVTP